jgi:hypothetical protein
MTPDQEDYFDLLCRLIEDYEKEHAQLDTPKVTALDALQHLLDAHDMSAADLARLLDVHRTLGRDDSARRTAVDAGARPHAGEAFLRVSRFVPAVKALASHRSMNAKMLARWKSRTPLTRPGSRMDTERMKPFAAHS